LCIENRADLHFAEVINAGSHNRAGTQVVVVKQAHHPQIVNDNAARNAEFFAGPAGTCSK
jgi:hypothetical protein